MAKLVIVVDDPESAMDSGCIHPILQECANHGKLVEAKYVLDDGRECDLLVIYEELKPSGGC